MSFIRLTPEMIENASPLQQQGYGLCYPDRFLINEEENKILMDTVKVLTIVQLFPRLQWAKTLTPMHMIHSLSDISAKKSKIVPLDILNADEKSYEDCFKILRKAEELATTRGIECIITYVQGRPRKKAN